MDEWHSLPWWHADWIPKVGIALLAVIFVASVIWFIDGIVRYAYWWRKDE